MKFGWLTLAHSPSPADDARSIFEQLEQAQLAEQVGFDGVWLTEHNFTGESVYVDPIPFAAALAMRTQRIRIGFAVIQMALRHPVRLATQLSLLDNLAGGRVDIGVGRGTIFNEYEFVGYGLRSDDARERMAEALDVMKRAWTAAPLDHKGKYFTLRLPALRPARAAAAPADLAQRRLGRLVPRLRRARRADPDRAPPPRTGRCAPCRVRSGPRCERARPHGAGAPRAGGGNLALGVCRESRAAAEDDLIAALVLTRRHMHEVRHDLNPSNFRVDPVMLNPWTDPSHSEEEGIRFALRSGTLIGTARDVAEGVAELRDAGVGHLLAR
jgi:alkanesulfonate monooxygenase SsuD/methylene tetrahydromethanopterin reductase-like flavin-dependent oxidoreductase (luciferase family)